MHATNVAFLTLQVCSGRSHWNKQQCCYHCRVCVLLTIDFARIPIRILNSYKLLLCTKTHHYLGSIQSSSLHIRKKDIALFTAIENGENQEREREEGSDKQKKSYERTALCDKWNEFVAPRQCKPWRMPFNLSSATTCIDIHSVRMRIRETKF